MNTNELIKKIDSERSSEIFGELYSKSEAGNARQRYKKLIKEMQEIRAQEHFSETENLRVFSAPGRTELAGNHTDHNHGKVLAASIQLDNTAIVQIRNDNIVFFRSTGFPDVKVKLTDKDGNPDLQPKPEEEGTTEALIRGIAAELKQRGCSINGFSANADSTVFAGSGLSSSAALETLFGRIFDSLYGGGKRSPLEIAQIGQIAENKFFGKPCGLMDQAACAAGGVVAINFANTACPEIKQINFDPAAAGFSLCVVNTGGSHADLTADYASIPAEMKKVAAFFGKTVLGELEKDTVLSGAADIRKEFGDRALLRAIHFYDENARVDAMTVFLTEMNTAVTDTVKQQALYNYLGFVNESGDSSWQLLQNIYSPQRPEIQSISVALALTKDFFRKQKLQGSCRVHGGGFAGTIQAYIPLDAINAYRARLESVFGSGSVTVLRIRPIGAVELEF
ncbi:MAG: galactokinase [Spirochaetes bacterium]|nr:galactokinase [Spirochaetota bacterium]